MRRSNSSGPSRILSVTALYSLSYSRLTCEMRVLDSSRGCQVAVDEGCFEMSVSNIKKIGIRPEGRKVESKTIAA